MLNEENQKKESYKVVDDINRDVFLTEKTYDFPILPKEEKKSFKRWVVLFLLLFFNTVLLLTLFIFVKKTESNIVRIITNLSTELQNMHNELTTKTINQHDALLGRLDKIEKYRTD